MIKEGAECLGKKTLFEQFVLQPLWDVHKSGLLDEDLQKLKVYFYSKFVIIFDSCEWLDIRKLIFNGCTQFFI